MEHSKFNMDRQWLGLYDGTNIGHITLNVELINGEHKGIAVLVDDNVKQYPWLMALVKLKMNPGNTVSGELSNFLPLHPQTFLPVDWGLIQDLYPGVTLPNEGSITAKIDSHCNLSGQWQTNLKTCGNFNIKSSDADRPSSCECEHVDWAHFKKYVSTLDKEKYIFRGQSEPWRLRTLYHRMNRSNMMRYSSQDVRTLHRHICATTNRFFNLNDSLEHGALLGLAQHYGYPTPLLDWTSSPYVAAYFAFSFLPRSDGGNVRIYEFDSYNWRKDTRSVHYIESPVLSLTILELMAIHNNRAIPQQSLTMFSNVDDIEDFIQMHENQNKKRYLKVFELPVSEMKEVLHDLSYMGVSGSSLFPGLDGVCRMLKEIYF